MGHAVEGERIFPLTVHKWFLCIASLLFVATCCGGAPAALGQQNGVTTWKPIPFAIVRYNDDAPKSWAIYHGEKKGVVLIRLWKRYLLVRIQDQEVYDLDPSKIKAAGDDVEFALTDVPDNPSEVSEWKERNVGPMVRIRFRFGKTGNYMDIELPTRADGKSQY